MSGRRSFTKASALMALDAAERRLDALEAERAELVAQLQAAEAKPQRVRLEPERAAVTAKLSLAGESEKADDIDVYVTVGLYDDGRPGEVFIHADRQGSTIAGFADALSIAISIGLQHGVPLEAFTSKLRRTTFPPSGWTRDDSQQRTASSIADYVAGWLERRFLVQGEDKAV